MAIESMSKMQECQFAMGLVHDAIKLAGSIIAKYDLPLDEFTDIMTDLSDLGLAALLIQQKLEKIKDGQDGQDGS